MTLDSLLLLLAEELERTKGRVDIPGFVESLVSYDAEAVGLLSSASEMGLLHGRMHSHLVNAGRRVSGIAAPVWQ